MSSVDIHRRVDAIFDERSDERDLLYVVSGRSEHRQCVGIEQRAA